MIPIPWTHKPPLGVPIDYQNGLTKELQCFLPMNEGSGPPKDSVTGMSSVLNGSCILGPNGLTFDGSAGCYATLPFKSFRTTGTIVISFNWGTRPAVPYFLYDCNSNRWLFYSSSASALGCYLSGTAKADPIIGTSGFYPPGINQFALTWDDVSNVSTFYENTVQRYTNSTAFTLANPTTGMILGAANTLNYQITGFIEYMGIWDRILTTDELRTIQKNPWQIYQSQLIPFSFQSAATIAMWCKVAGSLKAAEAMWIKTGGNLKLVESINAKVGGAIK
jgi:hypothetical protein